MIWFVAFHPKEPGQWWATRFGHVSLMSHQDGVWVHADIGRQHTSIRTVRRYDDVQNYLAFMCENHTILKFGQVDKPGGSFFRPMTCVAFVKQVLGIRARALRPDGLFKILLREPHVEIMNEDAQSRRADRNGSAERGAAPG